MMGRDFPTSTSDFQERSAMPAGDALLFGGFGVPVQLPDVNERLTF